MASAFTHFSKISRQSFMAILVLVAVAVTANAQTPAPLSPVEILQAELPEKKLPGFEEILRKALINGPTIIMREWDAAAASEDARGARASMLPSLNATVNAGVTLEQRRGGVQEYDRTFNAILYQVGFYQPIFHWGALSKNYQIGKIRQAIAERNLEETRRLLAIDIRSRYFDLIVAANKAAIARENLARLEQERKNTEQRIADGSIAPAAIDGANRAIDLALPELQQANDEYSMLLQSLAQLAGIEEISPNILPSEIPVVSDIAEALNKLSGSTTAQSSAQLQGLYDSINIEKLTYDINKTRQLPKVGLSASVGQFPDNAYNADKSLLTSWNASVSVNWNIFDGFASQASQKASLNRLRSLETQRSQIEKQESSQRRKEVENLLLAWTKLQNSERDLDRARGGYEVTQQDFAVGMVSQQQVDDSRLGYMNALQYMYTLRASFYISLTTCLSNRGQDPAINGQTR